MVHENKLCDITSEDDVYHVDEMDGHEVEDHPHHRGGHPGPHPRRSSRGVVKSDSSPYILQEQDVLKNINIVGMFKSKFSSEL